MVGAWLFIYCGAFFFSLPLDGLLADIKFIIVRFDSVLLWKQGMLDFGFVELVEIVFYDSLGLGLLMIYFLDLDSSILNSEMDIIF